MFPYHISYTARACMRVESTHICVQCALNGVRHGACYQINKNYSASIIIPSVNAEGKKKNKTPATKTTHSS